MQNGCRTPSVETLDYLRQMLDELRKMAQQEGTDALAYLIAMAHIEATQLVHRLGPDRLWE
jgi:hypothetical protein